MYLNLLGKNKTHFHEYSTNTFVISFKMSLSVVSKILYQIHYLMRASCNPSIVPQSSVRFQCRSGFWATNVDLGKNGINLGLPSRSSSSEY